MMFGLSPMELLVIGGLFVIFFGYRFPPPIARAKLERVDALDVRLPTGESRRPVARNVLIAVVVVEAVLVWIVIWEWLSR